MATSAWQVTDSMNYSISKDLLQTGLPAGLTAHFGFELQDKDQHQGLFCFGYSSFCKKL